MQMKLEAEIQKQKFQKDQQKMNFDFQINQLQQELDLFKQKQ